MTAIATPPHRSVPLPAFAASDAAPHAQPSRGVVAATVAGNALEFYDFVTYAFFAVYIGRTYFPSNNAWVSLLLSVAVFGVGFVSRPLGGVLIGAYADRAGRKPAMLLTIGLITVGTLGLALTPSYAQIGLAAPVIVVICRLIQGVALGGEVGPSTAYLVEIAPPTKRGFYASWQLASQGMSTLVAGLVGIVLTSQLSAEDLTAWGWRVPFLLGLALLPVAVYMRRNMHETLGEGHDAKVTPSLKPHTRFIALSILVILGGTVSTYVGQYMTTFAITTLKMPSTVSMGATLVVGVCTLVFSLVGGYWSDRVGRRTMMLVPRILLAVLTYPAFKLLVAFPNPATLFLVAAGLSSLTALSAAPCLIAIPELFPRRVRASCLSIAYAVGVAVFGGTTQFVVTWLIGVTQNPLVPGLYVAGTSVITAWAMWALPETRAVEV